MKPHFDNGGCKRCQHSLGTGPLQRQQSPVEARLNGAGPAQMRLKMRQIVMLAGGIDHQHQMPARIIGGGPPSDHRGCHHLIGEKGIALATRLQPGHIHRHQRFERQCGIAHIAGARPEQNLPHM
jgi:hypothetical protein